MSRVKCHLCGNAAKHTFAYARFDERDTLFGVIYRGVCGQCLAEYIEAVKKNRHVRRELFLWPLLFLPFGALLAALSKSTSGRVTGAFLLAVAVGVPILMRFWQRREAKRASMAGDAENEGKYSEQICREDAMRTSRQTKLLQLRPEYTTNAYSALRIAEETGVTPATAAQIKTLSEKALTGKYVFSKSCE
jgi:hypothetical protein